MFSLLAPPRPPLTQCAAVMRTFCLGLSTTLAVQKWLPLLSCSNSAPTRRVRAFWFADGADPHADSDGVADSDGTGSALNSWAAFSRSSVQ
jgi:hypothetical protein